jgi:hypothetical protein
MSCLKRSKTPNSPHEFEITRNSLIATGVVVLNNDPAEMISESPQNKHEGMHMKINATHIRNKTLVELNDLLALSPLHACFARDIDVLWIPNFDIPYGLDVEQEIQRLHQLHGDYRILRNLDDLAQLPVGIHGWIIPATADDSDLLCVRCEDGSIDYDTMVHPYTGETLTYKSSRGFDVKDSQNRLKYHPHA